MGLLTDRSALIVGGASGIGRAAALRFAAEGAGVLVADRDAAAGESVVREILAAGGRAAFVAVDVTDEDGVRRMVAEAERGFGAFSILLQTAGILRGDFESISELSLETWRQVIDVNLTGTFLCAKHAVPVIERAGGGVLLLLASGAGVRGGSSSLAYGASKGGVNGLGMTLAAQLAPRGIRVHVICPGGVNTPLKRENIRKAALRAGQPPPSDEAAGAKLVDPEGIARVLVFLASSEGDYAVGNVFTR
jgi:NAD(P)-dependent dehydrogenase (short-subunit alcohol dehydrogenase family)